jgi:hypothetical protein
MLFLFQKSINSSLVINENFMRIGSISLDEQFFYAFYGESNNT